MRKLRILYVAMDRGTGSQRGAAIRALGHELEWVATNRPTTGLLCLLYRVTNRLGYPFDIRRANRRLRAVSVHGGFDVVWVDKGITIQPRSLVETRRNNPRAALVSYSPDDMLNPRCSSVRYGKGIPLYDLHVTTKSYNVAELRELGAKDVFFVDNAYDPYFHRPWDLNTEERRRFATDVGFIGTYRREYAEGMRYLAEHGIDVRIWGAQWHHCRSRHARWVVEGRPLLGEDYAKAISATRINLGFLCKANRDLQTTRSVEIPACAGFLLAERTDEHQRLFAEGREAEFFGSYDELVRKCKHYLVHERERAAIAAAGRVRCVESGYSNEHRLGQVIAYLFDQGLVRA